MNFTKIMCMNKLFIINMTTLCKKKIRIVHFDFMVTSKMSPKMTEFPVNSTLQDTNGWLEHTCCVPGPPYPGSRHKQVAKKGCDNTALPAVHDKVHLMLVLLRHHCHKSSIVSVLCRDLSPHTCPRCQIHIY